MRIKLSLKTCLLFLDKIDLYRRILKSKFPYSDVALIYEVGDQKYTFNGCIGKGDYPDQIFKYAFRNDDLWKKRFHILFNGCEMVWTETELKAYTELFESMIK